MKAKLIIESGISTIILTAENEFEKTLIDDSQKDSNLETTVSVKSDYSFVAYVDQRIEIRLSKKTEQTRK